MSLLQIGSPLSSYLVLLINSECAKKFLPDLILRNSLKIV